MVNQTHLSRLSHPRANIGAVALLVVVFGLFGLWADAQTLPYTEIAGSAMGMGDLYEMCSTDSLSSVIFGR